MYKEPVKKLKKPLSIDIPDAYSDSNFTPVNSSSRAKSAQISFIALESPTSCRSSTSTPPRITTNPGKIEFTRLLAELDTQYDDLDQEEEFFGISMKKCNRKTMEDRVILILVTLSPF